jgi:hypothetical protein
MVAKQLKTADELKDIVAERLGVGAVLLTVNKDRLNGWRAIGLTVLQPANKKKYQESVDQIVAELREEYDLAE